jgi:hypothetical protein
MTINGMALLIWASFSLIVGIVCYAWGYTDARTEAKHGTR